MVLGLFRYAINQQDTATATATKARRAVMTRAMMNPIIETHISSGGNVSGAKSKIKPLKALRRKNCFFIIFTLRRIDESFFSPLYRQDSIGLYGDFFPELTFVSRFGNVNFCRIIDLATPSAESIVSAAVYLEGKAEY